MEGLLTLSSLDKDGLAPVGLMKQRLSINIGDTYTFSNNMYGGFLFLAGIASLGSGVLCTFMFANVNIINIIPDTSHNKYSTTKDNPGTVNIFVEQNKLNIQNNFSKSIGPTMLLWGTTTP